MVAILRTDRLVLVCCESDVMRAVMHRRDRVEEMTGLVPHHEWPLPDLAGALPLLLAAATGDPRLDARGWLPWLVGIDGVVAGDVGAHGAPDGAGVVEIGFSVVPAYRRRGIATEAVRAYCERLRADPEVALVVARVHPGNEPSMRVLERAGFRSAGGREFGDEGAAEAHLRYEWVP